jgi:hypothetical protein
VVGRRAIFFVYAVLAVAPADARAQALNSEQTPTSGKPPQAAAPRRDPALEMLAGDAAGLPPELAADALIRIAASSRVTDAAWKRELLTEAFFHAYGARDAYRRSTPQSIPPDTRQGAQLFAYATSLNRVSLQVRATQLMAYVDPPRARELFEWIDLDLSPAVCDEVFAPAVDEYYSALSLLARTTFGDDRAAALRFFELFLWRARLPSEIPAVARALIRFQPTGGEAAYLESVFGFMLETGSIDPRGFSTSAFDIVSRSADLANAYLQYGIRPYFMLESLRAYLITQIRGPRCGDSAIESMTPAAFNTALARTRMDAEIRPIDGDQLLPSRTLAAARLEPYWQSGRALQLRQAAIDLRGTGREPYPLQVRQTEAWMQQAERLLVDVEEWLGHGERTERDYFFQESALYLALLDLVPPSKLRTRTIESFVDFLRRKDDDNTNEPLWFAFLNRLLELSRGNDRPEILRAFDNAHNPSMTVYAQLERLVPVGAR